ncbi:hypothetical protein PoB_006161100 [Plakobranchus ocellatus]|uniref:Uncharacterized protein n=1 Tax=Plakobranchus ocellatus TaxID=259542 RepID=A0AAV4CTB7_9GAST|nr:hypothetical protein PoB_006161100 [Plakobranchus ocellatus]
MDMQTINRVADDNILMFNLHQAAALPNSAPSPQKTHSSWPPRLPESSREFWDCRATERLADGTVGKQTTGMRRTSSSHSLRS